MSSDPEVWQRTVTILEQDRPAPKPVLYKADGTPLAPRKPAFGFAPPRKDERRK